MTLVEPCFVFWRDFNHTSLICLNEPKTRVQLYLPSPSHPTQHTTLKAFIWGGGIAKLFLKSLVLSIVLQCACDPHTGSFRKIRVLIFVKFPVANGTTLRGISRKGDSLGRPKFITLEFSSRNVRNF